MPPLQGEAEIWRRLHQPLTEQPLPRHFNSFRPPHALRQPVTHPVMEGKLRHSGSRQDSNIILATTPWYLMSFLWPQPVGRGGCRVGAFAALKVERSPPCQRSVSAELTWGHPSPGL